MAEKPKTGETANREARLAAALRANLARRKALSRSLFTPGDPRSDDSAAAQADITPTPKTEQPD
ncbi:MAG: hypothetical protein ACMVO5_09065 [Polymorphobacter sp.]|uniref:hypothetical protein n=1 Tax=Polymorphobacter sp. TaxID=1909290 RepID=UPI003A88AEE1